MSENEMSEYCESCLVRKLDGCMIDPVQLSNCLRISNDKKAADLLKFNKKHDPG